MIDWRPALKECPGKGTVLSLKIVPRASSTRIDGLLGTDIKVRIQAPPVDGKANEVLLDFLCDRFHVSRAYILIVSGHTSRKKKILLAGFPIGEVVRYLGSEQHAKQE